jgi:sulfotransferase
VSKEFYFLSGFFRSGNTLLSSILNQNPDIYSSPLSPVPQHMWDLNESVSNTEQVLRNADMTGSLNILSNLLKNYYEHIDKPIIFDREKSWGEPRVLSLLKQHINPNPKIVYTVRPVVEVLTSTIVIFGNKIDQNMKNDNWIIKPYVSMAENRCDYLMRSGGPIDSNLMAIAELIKPENKDVFHIVEYDDLLASPQKTMNGIYDFINTPHFDHDFNNIIKIEKDNDEAVGLPANLHKIRPILSKNSFSPDKILPQKIIDRYSNMEFWRKP